MSDFNEPLYQIIYNSIYEDMQKGVYLKGDRIPSEKELAEKFKVSRITSKKALEMLSENGLIKRMPGKGSFVLDNDDQSIQKDDNNEVTKGSSFLIGVVMPDFSESYGTRLLSGIEAEASRNGYFIVPRKSYGNQDVEEEAIEALVSSGVDGIIVMPVHSEFYSPKILRLVLDGFPIVIVDRQLKGIPAPFVGTDNIESTKKGIKYLLELGHRNISVISPPISFTTTLKDRIDGYVKAYAEHGIAVDESIWLTSLVCTTPGDDDNKQSILKDKENIKSMLRENSRITCIFATEYNIALLAEEAVRELGKKIPEDISVMCYDSPSSFTGEYYLTHIRQNEEEMGSRVFSILQKQIEDGEKMTGDVFIEAELVVGKSTIKPNK
jgi:DNA-binding LacI/PurR family transcriptional regulator